MTESVDFDKATDKHILRAKLYCQENDMEVNEHGQYIYVSTNGASRMNLPFILQDYADQQANEVREVTKEIVIEADKDFDIKTLDDQMKYDFLVENFKKLKLIDLETLIK